MPWNKEDLTIISWGRFLECNPGDRLHRKFVSAHVESLASSGVSFNFIDFGSSPPLPQSHHIQYVDADFSSESVAKNHGLLSVETPLVVFTNWKTIISTRTIDRTIEHLNQVDVPEHFILQAFPWEMSNYHRSAVVSGEANIQDDGQIIENLSIPHSAPKLPGGDWQLCRTEDAAAIRGWSEDIESCCAADFHERMRAYCGWINGDNRGEILTRVIPVVVADFRTAQEICDDQQCSIGLEKYISTADPNMLGWRDPV